MEVMTGAKPEDEKRLLDAGFRPVVRWARGTAEALKTVEALTLLDRQEKK